MLCSVIRISVPLVGQPYESTTFSIRISRTTGSCVADHHGRVRHRTGTAHHCSQTGRR